MSSRKASHAGSWYSSSGRELSAELGEWLTEPEVASGTAKAIISPHAGYAYCGDCAGHCYKQMDADKIKRIFILGPSHQVALGGCAVTHASTYETPLYDLIIDRAVTQELMNTGLFEVMSSKTDSDEHSIEMQLPYIAKAMETRQGEFKIVPILVGSTTPEKEANYGRLLSKYFNDAENFFVISSDFCHWGRRFRFQHFDQAYNSIHESIEALDKTGMKLIEDLDVGGFHCYLKKFGNTICGRHPIGIFLNIIRCFQADKSSPPCSFRFLNYAQSGQCISKEDSSVSYAAGVLTFP